VGGRRRKKELMTEESSRVEDVNDTVGAEQAGIQVLADGPEGLWGDVC